MEKTNHPVDDIFSKGLSDFQVAPLTDTKKKVFASPAAIKPIKPWFIVSKNIIIFSSTLLVSSFLFYYFFFDHSAKEIVTDKQNNVVANTITKNTTTSNQENAIIENNENYNVSNSNKAADIKETTSNIEKSSNITKTVPVSLNTPEYKTDASILRHAQDFSMTKPQNETINNAEISSTNNTPVSLSGVEDKGTVSTNSKQDQDKQLSITNTLNQQVKDKQLTAAIEPLSTTKTPDTNNNLSNNNSSQPVLVNADYSLKNNTIISPTTTQNYDANVSATASIGINSSINKNILTLSNEEDYFSFMIKRTIPYINNGISYELLFTNKGTNYHLKGLWFVEVKAGCVVSNYNVKGKDSEWNNAAKAKQDLLTASFGNEVILNAVHQKNNWIIKGGISYVNYGEKLKGKVLLTNPYNETNISFNGGHYDIIIGGNYYLIDTTGSYYHFTYTQTDHIYKSDSIMAYNTQNVLADVYDTTQVTFFDSLPKTTINNNIRYVEIPLSVGYVIPYGRFTVGLNATVAPGYFINVNGSNMNTEQYPALEPYNKNTITKFTLSAGAELEFGYQINEGLMLSFSPFYRKSLFPMYNTEYQLTQKASHYGFRVGIRKLL